MKSWPSLTGVPAPVDEEINEPGAGGGGIGALLQAHVRPTGPDELGKSQAATSPHPVPVVCPH